MMANLALSPTRKYFGFGDKDDYVVLDGGRVIGRIVLHEGIKSCEYGELGRHLVMEFKRVSK